MINPFYKIKNTVQFYAEGLETEAFLSHCISEGIEIQNPIKKNEFLLYGRVLAKDYLKLRKPAKKFGLKLKINKKTGPYFYIKKGQKHAGMFFGIIYVMAFVFFMNQFVWEINVIGNEKVSADDIIASANKTGLLTGTFSRSHSVQDMEWYIVRENDYISSAEINIQGSIANILILEKNEEPKMKYDDDIPTNIIASKYGVIRKVNVFDGQSLVKPGDAVMKGDLLVSAVYEDSHKKLTLKHARAEIIAETDYCMEVSFPLTQTVETKDKIKNRFYEVEVLGKMFSLGNNRNKDNLPFEKEEKTIFFFWIKLPINVIITRYFDVKQTTFTYDLEQAKAGAYALLSEKEKKEMENIEILSRKTTERIKNGKYIIEAEYICLMDITEEQPIESNIPWENTDEIS